MRSDAAISVRGAALPARAEEIEFVAYPSISMLTGASKLKAAVRPLAMKTRRPCSISWVCQIGSAVR